MKILLGNNTLDVFGGTETWTVTMANELSKSHQVICYSPQIGAIIQKLNKNIKVMHDLDKYEQYDVCLCSHYHITKNIAETYKTLPIIVTHHGIKLTDTFTQDILPECPYRHESIKARVGVSEEIQKLHKNLFNDDLHIIRNPIDTKTFKPKPFNKVPKNIIFSSNYSAEDSQEVQAVKEMASKLNLSLHMIGYKINDKSFDPNVEETLKKADIVIGIGRTILEPMAMGIPVMCHGYWGTGGFLYEGNANEIRKTNYSGRIAKGLGATPDTMIAMINKFYNEKNADWCIDYINENHEASKIAKQYEGLINKVI